MNEHKTSDDIIAEMRSGQIPQHRHDRELLRHYAGLFEAALKRERARNFLWFATAEEAAKAWREHEENDTGGKFCAECPFDRGAVCARDGVCSIGWLYAETKKGGKNAD